MKEITDSNQTLGHSIVTVANPKLFISEDWLKGQTPTAETLLEIPGLVPSLIITKFLLTLKANSAETMSIDLMKILKKLKKMQLSKVRKAFSLLRAGH